MDLYTAPTYNFNRDSYRMQVSIGSVLYPSNPISILRRAVLASS
jgi:hypothetical protein